MSLLDHAAESIESWGGKREEDRARCLELFGRITRHMDRAISIWKAFLEKAPQSGDRYSAVLWMGAKPARDLQALHLENRAVAVELTKLTGVRFKDSLSRAEDLDIVQAYDQLRPDETGGDRAEWAIRTLTDRKGNIEAVIARLGG